MLGMWILIRMFSDSEMFPVLDTYLVYFIFVTAHKRSLRRLCFYTCLSFILFTGGVSASVHAGMPPPEADTPRRQTSPRSRPLKQTPPKAYTHPWKQTHPPEADTPRSRPPRSRPLRSRHPQKQTPPGSRHPTQSMLGDTVNARVVCILLECHLVSSWVRISIRNYRPQTKFEAR